jgi:hypothetical protein
MLPCASPEAPQWFQVLLLPRLVLAAREKRDRQQQVDHPTIEKRRHEFDQRLQLRALCADKVNPDYGLGGAEKAMKPGGSLARWPAAVKNDSRHKEMQTRGCDQLSQALLGPRCRASRDQ